MSWQGFSVASDASPGVVTDRSRSLMSWNGKTFVWGLATGSVGAVGVVEIGFVNAYMLGFEVEVAVVVVVGFDIAPVGFTVEFSEIASLVVATVFMLPTFGFEISWASLILGLLAGLAVVLAVG